MSKTYKLKELRKFRTQVDKERRVLKNVLLKLDQQIDALQVEQLNLLSLINAQNNTKVRKDTKEKSSLQTSNNQVTNQKLLDLSVPLSIDLDEEENEDDDNNSNMIHELTEILENKIDD
ncbi:hypothetical protein M0802_007294 [Mischocyttarus mexicanus]|nr:hypothetical protein M0802_007294 [Mischocyttarus mexicanus]